MSIVMRYDEICRSGSGVDALFGVLVNELGKKDILNLLMFSFPKDEQNRILTIAESTIAGNSI